MKPIARSKAWLNWMVVVACCFWVEVLPVVKGQGTEMNPMAINDTGVIVGSATSYDDQYRPSIKAAIFGAQLQTFGFWIESAGYGAENLDAIAGLSNSTPAVAVGMHQSSILSWDDRSPSFWHLVNNTWTFGGALLPGSWGEASRAYNELVVTGDFSVSNQAFGLAINGKPSNLSESADLGWERMAVTDINSQGILAGSAVKTQNANGTPIPPSQQVISPTVYMPVDLAVDANRDGNVEFAKDKTTAEKPFRFWINDDDDGAIATEIDTLPRTAPDYQDGVIKSRRDLEDFARLHVNIGGLNEALESGDIKATFEWRDVTGTPKIKLYRASKEGEEYLTDDAVANALTIAPFRDKLIEVTSGQTTQLPQGFWTQTSQIANIPKTLPTAWFLFEGSGEGKGRLVLTFWKGTEKIGEGGDLWLDIKDIKKMYVRKDLTGQWSQVTFEADPNETKQSIVFVHGWRMSPDAASSYAESMYKRLWHRGFKGRYAAFRWNTDYSDNFGWVPYAGQAIDSYLAQYNDSEHNAWMCGQALKSFVESMPTGSKNLIAHSMGNVVAGSAFTYGLSVDNYALLQAAIPASCYDESVSLKETTQYSQPIFGPDPMMWDEVTPDDDPDPPTRALAYRGRLKTAAGNLTSFYLPNDYATSFAWELNNDLTKPPNGILVTNFGYRRNDPSGQKLYKGQGVSLLYYLSDPYEAMPYADRSWSKAAGAKAGVGGAVDSSVALNTPAFGGTKGFDKEHSAEFEWRIQSLKPFYDRLLTSLQIAPNP